MDDLEVRVSELYKILEECILCPRMCKINRLEGELGYCKSGVDVIIKSAHPHFGEEKPLVGAFGSGTIFFTGCNLRCVYCQNYEISQLGDGSPITVDGLASEMLSLQKRRCHNINLVTPTHFVAQIVKAIQIAAEGGLRIPIVYNCGGYESVETLRLLDGIIDIYMPDFKYGGSDGALRFSDAPDYFSRCKMAVREMFEQVGDLKTEKGVAYKGLLIRHLVLPSRVASSSNIMEFIASLSKDSYVNIMTQYTPKYKAYNYKELKRWVSGAEYNEVIRSARKFGLHRGFQ
ncbi:MAG: radical SAM protein [Halobacteriota archaeon]|nr:radical SAM protein [Halobacteriota archaeon]